MDLLNLTPEQLKNMSKQAVHEGYKKVITIILKNFCTDLSNHFEGESMEELEEFIQVWVDESIKPAHKEWHPGDTGK
jgi:hypothetical protein